MKKHLLVFLLSLLGMTAQAQGTFAPLGAEWWYQDNSNRYAVWEPFNRPWADQVFVEKDTTVANINCRKLIVSRWRKFPENENKYLAETKMLFVYDNVDTVFMFNNYTNSFEPLYVFNAGVGDTVTVSTFSEPDWEYTDSNFRYVVDSIKTELYDNVPLKTFYTTSVWNSASSSFNGTYNFGEINYQINRHLGRYTEKLGGTSSYSSLLPNYRIFNIVDWDLPSGAPTGILHCYSDSTISITKTALPCDSFNAPLGIANRYINTLDLKVYPNPATDKLSFSTNVLFNDATIISIIDISGRLVWSTTLAKNNKIWTIQLPSLHKGIYLIKAKNSVGTLQQKLLLE